MLSQLDDGSNQVPRNDLSIVLYRQNIFKDCLKNPSIVRDIRDLSVEAIDSVKKSWWCFSSKYSSTILHGSIDVLQMFVTMLKKLRRVADESAVRFDSEGFTTSFAMIKRELGDEHFVSVQNHLKELKFHKGFFISAELGRGNRGTNYVLHKPPSQKRSWLKRIFGKKQPPCTFKLHPRIDDAMRYVRAG